MIRVKRTGEVSEVSRELMQYLRNEEKQLRRSWGCVSQEEEEESGSSPLSLDVLSEDSMTEHPWLEDPKSTQEEAETALLEENLMHLLTSRERDLYECCIRNGYSLQEYASQRKFSAAYASRVLASIRRKASGIWSPNAPSESESPRSGDSR